MDPLTSQGSLALSESHRFLFAVDVGSNEVSVLAVDDEKLTPVDRVTSGGAVPVSVTIRHNLVYVLHRGDPTVGDANVTGFTVDPDGKLSPLPGSTQMLVGGPNDFPAQARFTPDGTHLVVTETGNNLVDLLPIDDAGRAGQPVKNESSGAGPFGFTFARHDILIVSEVGANAASSYRLGQDGRLTVISGSCPQCRKQRAGWSPTAPPTRATPTSRTRAVVRSPATASTARGP